MISNSMMSFVVIVSGLVAIASVKSRNWTTLTVSLPVLVISVWALAWRFLW